MLHEYFRPYDEESSLEQAMRENREEHVLAVLEQDPNLLESINSNDDTPLHYAVRCGHASLVQRLYDTYPGMNHQKNNCQETPFDLAVAYGHEGVFLFFLDKNPELLDGIDVVQGHLTLAHKAAASGHKKMIEHVLERAPALIHSLDDSHNTVLHHAAVSGDRETAEFVLQKNPESLFMVNQHAETPVHKAVLESQGDVVAMFLVHDPEIIHLPHPSGEPLVHQVACRSFDVATMRALLEVSTDQVHLKDSHGCTPLHHAAIAAWPEGITFLIQHGAPVNMQDDDGDTPLHLAVNADFEADDVIKTRVVQLLVAAGADPYVQNEEDESAFSLACPNYQKVIVDALENSITKRFKKRADALLLDVLLNRSQAELMPDRTPCMLASLPDEMLKAIVSHTIESHEVLGPTPLPSDFNEWFATSFQQAQHHAVGHIQEQCASAFLCRRGNTTVERMVAMGQQQAEEARLHDLHQQGTHQLVLYRP